MYKCNVCSGEFSEDEGGVEGSIGILPVYFCPTCLNGIFEMVEQFHLEDLRKIESQLKKSVRQINQVRNEIRCKVGDST